MTRFVRHARNRMRRYQISQEEVIGYIAQPEWDETEDDGHTQIAWVRKAGLYLKIVYSIEDGDVVVITVGPRERLPEGLA